MSVFYNYDLPEQFEQYLLRYSLSQTHSYCTLAINLKLFAHLRGYFFKAQTAL